MSEVPVVDISNPTATSMAALDAACCDHGFFLIEGYGLDDLVARMWQQTEREGLVGLGPTALGHHTDPGVITLLLQDQIGGLQARTCAGDWIDIDPRPGTVIVNLADVMQVWTNDRYIAAVHRVVPMTDERRFSISLFFTPVRGAMIEPLPELCEGPAQYREFAWREFMRARNDDNFADAGAADTQISDYLIPTART